MPIPIIWHGGEPLACGIKHFSYLINQFEESQISHLVKHGLQTNATLINEDWCRFFIEQQISIGVSIDGPEWANTKRVDWKNSPTFAKTLQGINLLKEFEIPFNVIAVITEDNLPKSKELYDLK